MKELIEKLDNGNQQYLTTADKGRLEDTAKNGQRP